MGHLDDETLGLTWRTFKDSGQLDARNELVVHYTSLVRYVAAKVGGTLPSMVDRDDLISYGMFGLIDAIDKFDIDKGVKFETYGVARIRGAIYDEIRSQDWVPRSIRSKARDIDRARGEVEALVGRPATSQEVAQHLGLSLEEFWELSSQAAVAPIEPIIAGEDPHYAPTIVLDPMKNPEDLMQTGEISELVSEAIASMDERTQTILVLYYLQEMTLAEIGKILGVTQSRVCQLQSKALIALREFLGQGGLAAA